MTEKRKEAFQKMIAYKKKQDKPIVRIYVRNMMENSHGNE